MDNPQGSLTSAGAAGLRAAHQFHDGHPGLMADPVILRLLDATQVDMIRNNPQYFMEPRLLGLRSHIVLRSRYAEDRLAQAYSRGIRQYLLLGAGLDTFAWRRPASMDDLRVYEADHPATQAQKRSLLAQAGMAFPENYVMVPVDFESGTIAEALAASSFDPTTPSFISCLGVMIYLSEAAEEGIFRFVAGLPPTTEFVFTFGRQRSSPHNQETAARVATAGEPFRTFHEPGELALKLQTIGYTSVHFLEPAEAAALYYTGRPHGLPVPSHSSIAVAIV